MEYLYSAVDGGVEILGIKMGEKEAPPQTLNIPREINGMPCVAISGVSKLLESYIQEITFPDTLKTIKYRAFEGYCNLKKISFMGESIEPDAFKNCEKLEDVSLGKCLRKICREAFFSTALKGDIVLPSSVVHIGPRAFANCKKIESVVWPENCMTISESCFAWSGIKKILNVQNVLTVERTAFSFSQLEEFPSQFKNIINIGAFAFENTKISSVYISNVETLGKGAFTRCKSLLNVEIASVKIDTIDEETFSYCSHLKNINCSKISVIKDKAFRECTDLASFDFSNVTKIGCEAFRHSGIVLANLSSVNKIECKAFYSCLHLERVMWGNCERIPEYCFADCPSLTMITNLSKVTDIQAYAFLDAASLHSIPVGDHLKSIGNGFAKMSGVKSFYFGPELYNIAPDSFAGCHMLYTVTIMGQEIAIRNAAFKDCINLSEINNSDRIVLVASNAFRNTLKLKNIQLNCNLEKIEKCSFKNSGIEKITIPQFCTKIGYSAFECCKNLREVTWSPLCHYFPKGIFKNCHNLKEIKKYHLIKSIGSEAFMNTSVEELKFNPDLRAVGGGAFEGARMKALDLSFSSIFNIPVSKFIKGAVIDKFRPPVYCDYDI